MVLEMGIVCADASLAVSFSNARSNPVLIFREPEANVPAALGGREQHLRPVTTKRLLQEPAAQLRHQLDRRFKYRQLYSGRSHVAIARALNL
jgi:hypothetical protein